MHFRWHPEAEACCGCQNFFGILHLQHLCQVRWPRGRLTQMQGFLFSGAHQAVSLADRACSKNVTALFQPRDVTAVQRYGRQLHQVFNVVLLLERALEQAVASDDIARFASDLPRMGLGKRHNFQLSNGAGSIRKFKGTTTYSR